MPTTPRSSPGRTSPSWPWPWPAWPSTRWRPPKPRRPPRLPKRRKKSNPQPDEKTPKRALDGHLVVELTLAHPATEIARVACGQIKQQLKLIGIDVTLKPLPPGPITRVPDDADLLYAEWPMWEPIVDARRFLGADGPARGASAYMSLALRQLEQSSDWRKIRPKLREIHRIAHNDVAVIPLWQLVDHFAHHKSLRGVGSRPVSLYENVEQWQLSTPTPAEAK